MILSELALLCNTDKSTVVRTILDLHVETITDNEGRIIESVKNEIFKTMQRTHSGRDSP